MKKEFFLGMLVLAVVILFVTSCAPMPRYYVCPDGSKVLNPDDCLGVGEEEEEEKDEPGAEPEPVVEEETKEPDVISEEAQALFDSISKVNSVQYNYVESPETMPEHTYYVSRDKMRIDLEERVKLSKTESYDNVYLDLVDETAVAYCEYMDRTICPDRDKAYEVEFEDYYIETPFDWVAKITGAELTGRSQTMENRNAIEVEFEVDGESGTMFVDSFFGIPMKITMGDKSYEFRNLFTQISPEELEHQSIE